MKGKLTLYRDQWGNCFFAHTVEELRKQIPGHVSKMYIDGKDGIYHIGYVIGSRWLSAYSPVRIKQG